MIRPWVTLLACAATPLAAAAALPAGTDAFLDTHCAGCHNDVDKEANLRDRKSTRLNSSH